MPLVTVRREDGRVLGSTRYLALRPERPQPRDRLDVAHPGGLGHGRERRGEAADARARLRAARLPAGRAEDRRPQRALARRHGGAAGPVRGRPPQAHARPRRRAPRLGLVQRARRRMAGGAGESASPARAASDTLRLPGIRQRNWSHQHDRESSRDRRWTRRVGDRRALRERGLDLDAGDPELVLLCVPDRAIAEVAAAIGPRPVARARQRRDPARSARAARAALRPASAADVHARPRRRAARRRLRGDHGRDRRGAAGRRSGSRACSASSRSRSPTRSARPTTPARRSPRTTSSRCGVPPARCSRRPARHPRRSTR